MSSASLAHLLTSHSVLLLDMNSTFMFGEDRFSPEQDYAATYAQLGGATLSADRVHHLITSCYAYLDIRYPDPAFHDAFPSVLDALNALPESKTVSQTERQHIADTFAAHEIGHIPPSYADALRQLAETHRLAVVADIWADAARWRDAFVRADVADLFEVTVFSSAIGSVKPSPRPFLHAIRELGVATKDCLVIGDSVRRDIGGARAAGIASIWIGEGPPPKGAHGSVPDLRDLAALSLA